MKKKKKGGSFFAVLVVIVLILIVAATVAVNVIFSGDKTPQVAGYYLYSVENADMAPDIPQNSLVIAKKVGNASVSPGNKVLCYLADGSPALRVIYQITVNEEDGATLYYPGTAVEQGSELAIPKANIQALCVFHSQQLYAYVNFATSVGGLMALLVVPCIIMIVMLLVRIARGSGEDLDEEEFVFEEPVASRPKKKRNAENPLFEASQLPPADASIEMKKSSISDHFEQKPVNENSPYQKAVKERTMRFQIQQQNIEEAQRQQAASQQGTRVISTQEVESMALQQRQGYRTPSAPFASQPEYHAPETQEMQEEQPVRRPAAPPQPVKRSPQPNIDDIIRPSELRASKNGQKINQHIASTDSIDDLIRALENEKKKL